MDLERLKRTLAKLGIAGLIAGSALTFTGCPEKANKSPTSDKAQTPDKSAGSGSHSTAGGSGQQQKGGSS